MSTRTARFVQGAGWGYLHQLTVMVVGVWLTPFFLRQLGQFDFGLWLIGLQVVNVLMLVDFGILAMFPRTIAQATGRGGGESAVELRTLMEQTLRIVLWQTLLVGLAAAAGWYWLPREWAPLRAPLGYMLLSLVLLFPARLFPAAMTGLQRQAALTRIQFGAWVLSTAVTVSLVRAGWGLNSLAAGWVTSQLLISLLSFAYLRKQMPHLIPRRTSGFAAQPARSQFASSFWYSTSQFAQLMLDGLDLLLVGKWMGASAAVIYSCTGKLPAVLNNQPHLVLSLASPGLTEIASGADADRAGRVISSLIQATLLFSGAICCLVIVVNEAFVRWWVGDGQYGGLWLTGLIVARMLVRHVSVSLAYSALALGCERRLALIGLAHGLAAAGAMALLLPWFGLEGAVGGSLLAALLVSLPMNALTLAQAAGFSQRRMILGFTWRFVLVAGACLALASRSAVLPSAFSLAVASIAALSAYALWFASYFFGSPLYDYARLAWSSRVDPHPFS